LNPSDAHQRQRHRHFPLRAKWTVATVAVFTDLPLRRCDLRPRPRDQGPSGHGCGGSSDARSRHRSAHRASPPGQTGGRRASARSEVDELASLRRWAALGCIGSCVHRGRGRQGLVEDLPAVQDRLPVRRLNWPSKSGRPAASFHPRNAVRIPLPGQVIHGQPLHGGTRPASNAATYRPVCEVGMTTREPDLLRP